MDEYKVKTLDYYNENAQKYAESTLNADMSFAQRKFLSYLNKGDKILDLGCGSGRDSLCFINQGFNVEAVDGAANMCEYAQKIIGQPVRCIMFSQLDYDNCFDGVWACASLLHVPKEEITDIILKVNKSLKDNGIFYATFKYGDNEYVRDGRYFCNYTSQSINNIINKDTEFEIIEQYISMDVRSDRSEEKWINVICRKI